MSAQSIITQRRTPRIGQGFHAWILAVGMALGLLPLTASALDAYSIQIARFDDATQAEQARAAAAETCSPAFVQEDATSGTTTYKVLVGRFPYYAEAWARMKKLQGQGLYPGSSVATWSDTRETSSSEVNVLPVDMPFVTAGLDTLAGAPSAPRDPEAHWKDVGLAGLAEPDAALLATSPDAMSQAELLQTGLAASDKTVAVPALQRLIAANPSAPEINRARLRLARLTGASDAAGAAPLLAAVRASGTDVEKALCDLIDAYILTAQKKRPESMAAFKALANNPALAPSLRLEAMERVARQAHALRDYPTAWLAFEQLEAAAPDGATAAVARMQRAACAFELVTASKSTWDETIRLCDSVFEIDGASKKTLATARLMRIEALYKQGKTAEAFTEVTAYLEEYRDIPREYFMALNWRGIFLCDLRQYDESEAVFTQVLGETIPEGEKFAGSEPKAMAARWLMFLAERKGDSEASQAYLEFLAVSYPNHWLGKDARKTLDANVVAKQVEP